MHSGDLKVLDVRPPADFAAARLIRSHNIPEHELKTRFFELPDRVTSFGVLCPTPESAAQWSACLSGSWNLAWVLVATPQLLQAAQELQVTEAGAQPQATLLFSPCPLLSQRIDRIESQLQAPGALTCLDVGCGSGRDMIYLATRGWTTVHGLDNWKGAVQRARTAACNYGVEGAMAVSRVQIALGGAVQVLEPSELADSLGTAQHGLVLCVRFLNRGLFESMRRWTMPGGLVMVSTFLEDPAALPEVRVFCRQLLK